MTVLFVSAGADVPDPNDNTTYLDKRTTNEQGLVTVSHAAVLGEAAVDVYGLLDVTSKTRPGHTHVKFTNGDFGDPLILISNRNVPAPGTTDSTTESTPFVHSVLRELAVYDALRNAVDFLEQIDTERGGTTTFGTLLVDEPFFGPTPSHDEGTLYIGDFSSANEIFDKIAHEFGHFVAYKNGIGEGVGGDHGNFNERLRHDWEFATKIAFDEGFGDWFGAAANFYQTTDAQRALPFLKTGDKTYITDGVLDGGVPGHDVNGEDTELSVAQILWDLADSDNEQDHAYGYTFPVQYAVDDHSLGVGGVVDRLIGVNTLGGLWAELDTTCIGCRLKLGALFQSARVAAAPVEYLSDGGQGIFTFEVPSVIQETGGDFVYTGIPTLDTYTVNVVRKSADDTFYVVGSYPAGVYDALEESAS